MLLYFSRLDYCNSILFGLPNTELQKLQRVQNTAARLITFKVVHGLAPKYLGELLTCKTKCNYNLR